MRIPFQITSNCYTEVFDAFGLCFQHFIIIIIISIFKEDNVFSITASLPYGPPVNTDIDYYQTFFGLVYFESVARLVVRYFVRRTVLSRVFKAKTFVRKCLEILARISRHRV